MAVPFASVEWVQAFMEEINQSQAYEESARTWEGDFYFVIEPKGEGQEPISMYLDLWHGKCREAFLVDDPAVKNPEFVISGPLSVWKRIIEKKLDPMQALITRQLKLKGTMTKIMKYVKAAQELVNCTTRIGTEFPA